MDQRDMLATAMRELHGGATTPQEWQLMQQKLLERINSVPMGMGPGTGMDPYYNANGQYIGPPIINPNTGLPW